MQKKYTGFTLVELMIVVGIIAVIMAIAIPQFQTYLMRSKRTEAKVALSGLAQLQESFYGNNGNAYTTKFGAGGLNCHKKGLCKGATDAEAYTVPDGHYKLTMTGTAASFTITATAVSPSQLADTKCQTFAVNSSNQRTATPAPGTDCW